jgi:glycosyltransferase involved in cell wall biosynthesis
MISLALNMILGPGDGKVARRFFSSYDMRTLFDEIVIINTCEKDDEEVRNVISQYADRTGNYKWGTGDFAGARNMALAMTLSQYAMWIDSDDLIELNGIDIVFRKIHEVITVNPNIDFFVAPYILKVNPDGTPGSVFARERIIKKASGIKWTNKIHEQLTIVTDMHKRADLEGLHIIHCPVKTSLDGLARNLKILEHEYLSDPTNRHYAFYFARDLAQDNQWPQAAVILTDFINETSDDLSNVYEACLILAKFYLYKQTPNADSLCKTTVPLTERYLRISFALTQDNAEPLVILGDNRVAQKLEKEAIRLYESAISKKFGTGALQDKAYYEDLPSQRLASLYLKAKELEKSLWYNKVALKHHPEDTFLLSQRKQIINDLR